MGRCSNCLRHLIIPKFAAPLSLFPPTTHPQPQSTTLNPCASDAHTNGCQVPGRPRPLAVHPGILVRQIGLFVRLQLHSSPILAPQMQPATSLTRARSIQLPLSISSSSLLQSASSDDGTNAMICLERWQREVGARGQNNNLCSCGISFQHACRTKKTRLQLMSRDPTTNNSLATIALSQCDRQPLLRCWLFASPDEDLDGEPRCCNYPLFFSSSFRSLAPFMSLYFF